MFSTFLPHLTYFLKDFSTYLLLITFIFFLAIVSSFKIFKLKISENRKKVIIVTIFSFFIFSLIFSVFEAYFRYAYDVPDGLGFLKVSRKWAERHVVYNNYFYRDRNFEAEKKEETMRIGVLGDSIVWGAGIENPQDRFSNILERKLNTSGFKVEVYNLGRPGYDTQQEIEEFEKVRHLNFDIIIWNYFLNDVQPSIKSTGTRIIETNRDLPIYITFFTSKSYFLDYLFWRLSPTHQKTFKELRVADIAQYDNQEILLNHKERIAGFIKSFEGSDTKILAVIFPSMLLLGPDYPEHIHELMNDVFRENLVDTIDLLPVFINEDKRKLMASKFDPHPSELAHQIAANKLFDYFLAAGSILKAPH